MRRHGESAAHLLIAFHRERGIHRNEIRGVRRRGRVVAVRHGQGDRLCLPVHALQPLGLAGHTAEQLDLIGAVSDAVVIERIGQVLALQILYCYIRLTGPQVAIERAVRIVEAQVQIE